MEEFNLKLPEGGVKGIKDRTGRDPRGLYCFTCGKFIGRKKGKITLGMYGTRGSYCSEFHAFVKQPGWVDSEKAAKQLDKLIKESNENLLVFHVGSSESTEFLYELIRHGIGYTVEKKEVKKIREGKDRYYTLKIKIKR